MTAKQIVNGNVFRGVVGVLAAITLAIGGWLASATSAHIELDGHPVLIERTNHMLDAVHQNGEKIERIEVMQTEQMLILNDIKNDVKILAKEK